MQMLTNRLEATFRFQGLNKRHDLEQVKKEENFFTNVITLNINGIKSKYNELLMLIQRRKPDILCLQETKKTAIDKRTHINGYVVHEVPAKPSKGLSLAICFRKEANLTFNIIFEDSNLLTALFSSDKHSSIIGCIYRPHDSKGKKSLLSKIENIVNSQSNKHKCLFVGN